MGRLIDADALREDILHDNTFDNDTVNYYLAMVDGMETAYDVESNAIIDAMAKAILHTDFGNCALCDNYAKNITIDGINNGCDGNCRHDKEYTEEDMIKWFQEQLR